MNILLLDNTTVGEATAFYKTHADYGLLYPRDSEWIKNRLGKDFFLVGVQCGEGEELIAIAWIAKLQDLVYFTVENDNLLIRNDGAYTYSGGWCIKPDYRGFGFLKLLAASVNLLWFTKINKREEAPILWGRMAGVRDVDGNPLFWNKVGGQITGLSYPELLALPFGTMEEAIFARWPKEPIPFQNFSQDIIEQTLGRPHKSLIGPLNKFIEWGAVTLVDYYVPTSLNRFHFTTRDSIKDPEKFFFQALRDVSK